MPWALRAASGAQGGSRSAKEEQPGEGDPMLGRSVIEKVRLWVPFWAPVDFRGGPKIMFLGIMLEQKREKGCPGAAPDKKNMIR